jgi:hypothetical protein
MYRLFLLTLTIAVVLSATCSRTDNLPDDPNLEIFIETSARCAYVERAFSHEPDVLENELRNLEFPPGWEDLVDSLLNTYGADPEFWYMVYTEIVERSRR